MGLSLSKLGEIVIDGSILNLDTMSIDELKKYREKLNEKRSELQAFIKTEVMEKE